MSDQTGIISPERIVSQESVNSAPIIYTDGPIGVAAAHDMLRIVLGAEIFNADPASDTPKLKPVANIVMHKNAVLSLVDALMQYLSKYDEDEEEEQK